LGKLSLNLCRTDAFPAQVADSLQHVLEALLPRVISNKLTLQGLSSKPMFPSKDYSSNRLRYGLLQACEETELFLDQTTLDGGQLSTIGVTNIARISSIMTQQKLEYDFQFYQQGFDTDMRYVSIPKP